MELNLKIKDHRQQLGLSQEALAEKVYVSRQTVSNWETGKIYPDLNSLLQLSSVFGVSVDQLIKGDLKMMQEKVNEAEVRQLDRLGYLLVIAMAANILVPLVVAYFFGFWGFAAFALLLPVTGVLSRKVEKLKQNNQLKSFKQILAFSEGQKLDEIENKVEAAKAPYQQIIVIFIWMLIGAVTGFFLMKWGLTR